jgi:hypothetical protein
VGDELFRVLGVGVSRKDKIWIGSSVAITVLVWSLVLVTGSTRTRSRLEATANWNQGRISVAYVGSQVKQLDKSRCSLIISYNLQNSSSSDYRLTEGSNLLILSRLKSDGSLSQEQPVRLSYPVFLPPGQHARLAVEITGPFAWPTQEDPAYLDKLREFVKRRLENVAEFLVFDQDNHSQLQLPSGWGELWESRTGSWR